MLEQSYKENGVASTSSRSPGKSNQKNADGQVTKAAAAPASYYLPRIGSK